MHCRTEMKYFLILLVSTASLVSVSGKIPDFIQICKSKDPQLSQCIHNSINHLKNELVEGIPQLSVPPMDPLHLKELILNLGSGFKATGRDLSLTGGRNFKLRDLVVNITANTYYFDVTIPEVIANGTYEIDAALASIPIRGKGPIHLTARSVSGQGTLHGKKVMRGGKTFNWFSSLDMKLEIDDYDMKLENLFEGDPTIGEVTNKLLNEEKTQVLATLLPGLEKALIEHILLTGNNICKHFSWDELFPES